MIKPLLSNRYLILQMVRREIQERYRGSLLGLLWTFVLPLLMLGVYVFVFGVVFEMRWGVERDTDTQFAVVLFAGLIVHALFADCLTRAPGLITGNVQYVQKVVFPLEVLPVVALGSALFHFVVSVAILLAFILVSGGAVPLTALYIPLVIAPLAMMAAGVSWFLASLSVYLRDIGQVVGVLTTMLLFLAPMFYSIDAVPEHLRQWIYLNPLTVIIIEMRKVAIWGSPPDWQALGLYTLIAVLIMLAGYFWFQHTRRGFADVL